MSCLAFQRLRQREQLHLVPQTGRCTLDETVKHWLSPGLEADQGQVRRTLPLVRRHVETRVAHSAGQGRRTLPLVRRHVERRIAHSALSFLYCAPFDFPGERVK